MVELDKIRDEMRARLEIDNQLHNVEVNAATIDEALQDAAVQLDTKVTNLSYEIIEKGSDGFFTLGRKPWKLKIYQNPDTIKKERKVFSRGGESGQEETISEIIKDRDGLFYVRHFGTNIMLKVLTPMGNGEAVSLRDVMDEVNKPDTVDIDESAIKKAVKQGTEGEYIQVGTYKHVKAGDVLISVEISRDEMKASINVSPPSMSGGEASFENICRVLMNQGVMEACINKDKVIEFVDNPVYNIGYDIAFAIEPIDGRDAYVQYEFETDVKKLKAKVSDKGQINYKQLNQIQNVIAGQPLAQKILAEKGRGGKTVLGRYLEAKNGKDITVQLGQNTEFDKDGVTILASIDGEVMLINNRVTVAPVKVLDAVNVKTGDIKFFGSVIIKGNVEDGYRVEATNIEVHGLVDRSVLIASENIVVQSGIYGKGEGSVKAGKSLWAKFINDCNVEVEDNVIVYDSIVNSNVTAMKNIIVKGKKAQIIGGHLCATEEICARKIGSPGGGTETILEVGIDPRAKARLDVLQKKQSDATKQFDAIELNIQTLEQQKKLRKKLPKEKEDQLILLKQQIKDIAEELREMTTEIDQIQDHLRELKAVGKVKAEGDVYSGVKIYIRDTLDEVKLDTKNVTFYYDRAFCKRGPYEPPTCKVEEPDGYAN